MTESRNIITRLTVESHFVEAGITKKAIARCYTVTRIIYIRYFTRLNTKYSSSSMILKISNFLFYMYNFKINIKTAMFIFE